MAYRGGKDHFGWVYANKVFAPSGDYLHAEDIAMDWLYKVRATIGAALLVVIGIRYHQPANHVIAVFDPVLGGIGGITGPLILGLLFVAPSTAAVVLYTVKGRRDKAFRQMINYPVKTALICLGIYGFFWIFDQILRPLVATGSPIGYLVGIGGGLISLRYCLFLLRGIYLVTVGICRLGDGHPLLPPIAGSIIAWVVALSGSTGTGEPSPVWLAALLGGPASITLLGYIEIMRLRTRYRPEFPFHDGPLPALKLNEPALESVDVHDGPLPASKLNDAAPESIDTTYDGNPVGQFAGGDREKLSVMWSYEDQGLLRAYELHKYLSQGNEPIEIPPADCPVRLKSEEKCLAITKSRLFKFQPENQSFTAVGAGPLVLTNLALIQSADGRTLRFRRVAIASSKVDDGKAPFGITQDHSPFGIRFGYHRSQRSQYEEYWIDLPAVDRRYLAFLLKFTYAGFNFRGDFKVPEGFIERARKLGKL